MMHDSIAAHFDWRIEPQRLEVCKRPDGSYWKLGGGGYGEVPDLFLVPAFSCHNSQLQQHLPCAMEGLWWHVQAPPHL